MQATPRREGLVWLRPAQLQPAPSLGSWKHSVQRDGAALGSLGPWAIAPCPAPGHSLQEEGPGHGLAPDVGPVEQRVEVGQQRVA